MEQPDGFISLQQVSSHVNNVNLQHEVVVFDHNPENIPPEVFPIRIDALILILCVEGTGRIGINLCQYDIEPNTLIVIHPKNYISLYAQSDDFRAHAVACSRHIVEDVIPKLTDLLPLLVQHRSEPVVKLSQDDADTLMFYYRLLNEKISRPQTPFSKQKVICLLQAALFEMVEINYKASSQTKFQRSRKEEIMGKFILSVSENFREKRQVADYANQLCITPKHLSTVVKEISGLTAGQWIENYVTMEAKVMLKSTDMSVQEISQHLNFPNQSFFGKYFRRQTGMSPSAYRRQNG